MDLGRSSQGNPLCSTCGTPWPRSLKEQQKQEEDEWHDAVDGDSDEQHPQLGGRIEGEALLELFDLGPSESLEKFQRMRQQWLDDRATKHTQNT